MKSVLRCAAAMALVGYFFGVMLDRSGADPEVQCWELIDTSTCQDTYGDYGQDANCHLDGVCHPVTHACGMDWGVEHTAAANWNIQKSFAIEAGEIGTAENYGWYLASDVPFWCRTYTKCKANCLFDDIGGLGWNCMTDWAVDQEVEDINDYELWGCCGC